MNEEVFFEWQTPESIYREKSSDWYWTVSIISIAAAITSFMLGNALFALVIVLGVFSLLMYAGRRPNIIDIQVLGFGIRAGKYVYPYAEIESFWIALYHNHERLLLKSRKKLAPLVSIMIPHEVPLEDLRTFLLQKMKEKEVHEPLIQHLMEYLGF